MNIDISTLKDGDSVDCAYYIAKDLQIKTTVQGKPYLSGTLCDKTGNIAFKMWNYMDQIPVNENGVVCEINATIQNYKGTLQANVSKITKAQEGDYNLSELVPSAPIDVDKACEYIEGIIMSMKDEDIKKLTLHIFREHKESFKVFPAAKSVHHSFMSGLCMHTSNMLRCAEVLSKIYKNTINSDLLFAGVILHDIEKDIEFETNKYNLVENYSTEGELLGHLVMSAREIDKTANMLGTPKEKAILLEHLVISHHGKPEFGSPVYPMTAEAELLNLIDLIDSRMEIYEEKYEQMENGAFSDRIFALDHKIYKSNI